MTYKIIGGFLIVIALAIFGTVLYRNSRKSQQPEIYSPTFMLNALWASYKKNYIDSSTGRTLDPSRQNITTSEGESYTMLRAVWEDDKATFDQSWQWTQGNLGRPNDSLFSWLYGQNSGGSYGILTSQNGQNSATDADTDIALALIEASARWQNASYLYQAKKIISSIWEDEVVTVKGVPYITADNLEQNATSEIVVDPSYFAPYAYRIFAEVDPADNWNAVIDSSFEVINKASTMPLDKTTSAGLPPDWVTINKTTGAITAANTNTLDTNYGYDALRVPFRLALDYIWNQDPRDKAALENFGFLGSQWQSKGLLYTTYGHDGRVVSATETPAMYGGALGYFMVTNPAMAEAVYNNKLLTLYSPDNQDWSQNLGYYDANWAWFGMALYNNSLTNFYQPN